MALSSLGLAYSYPWCATAQRQAVPDPARPGSGSVLLEGMLMWCPALGCYQPISVRVFCPQETFGATATQPPPTADSLQHQADDTRRRRRRRLRLTTSNSRPPPARPLRPAHVPLPDTRRSPRLTSTPGPTTHFAGHHGLHQTLHRLLGAARHIDAMHLWTGASHPLCKTCCTHCCGALLDDVLTRQGREQKDRPDAAAAGPPERARQAEEEAVSPQGVQICHAQPRRAMVPL